MTKAKHLSVAIRAGLGILAGLTIVASPGRAAYGADTDAQKQHRAMFLRGAELWPVYCNMCHNARPPTEFSPTEWNMIMMHMRSQANLPADDARAILEYLKAAHE